METGRIKLDIIGYDSGWGCQDYRCEDGPLAVAPDQLLHALQKGGVAARWRGPLGLRHLGDHAVLKSKEDTLPVVRTALSRLCSAVRSAVENGHKPVVVGGDHASAIGTWSGVVSALNCHRNFGLIWIDAHLDSHTYATSYQGKWGGWWHGQPAAALVGEGLPDFTHLGSALPKISPEHLCIIGAHSFEPAEEEFVRRHKIRVFYLDEVKKRGFADVFSEAMARVANGTSGFGMTIDLDAFSPADAPGVSSRETDGLIAAEVLPIIRSLGHNPLFRALEVAELNPHRDVCGITAQLLEKVIESVFTKD